MSKLFLLPVLFLIFLATAAQAATYYVAQSGCSDSGSGIEAQPWCTIKKANESIAAGDIVYVKQGTYTEPIMPLSSGSQGNYITYKAFGSDSVIINPSADLPSGTVINGIPNDEGQSRGIYLLNVSYIHIEGFKFLKPGRWLWAERAQHNVLKGNEFSETTASGGTKSGLYFFDSQFNKVIGNHIENPSRSYSSGGDSIVFAKSNRNAVVGNTFGGAGHAIFAIRCSNYNIFRDNYFSNGYNKIGEVYDSCVYGLGCVTEHNLIESNEFALATGDGDNSPEAGIQYAGQHGIIRENAFYNNLGGLNMTLYSGSACGSSPPFEAIQNFENKVYNNVFYNNSHGGITVGTGLSSWPFYGNAFKNNIFYKNNFQPESSSISWWNELAGKPVQFKTARLDGFVFEKNDVFNQQQGEDYAIIAGGTSPLLSPPNHPVSWWQTNYSQTFSKNIELEPQFANAASHDFHLASGSPMVDAGVFLTKTSGAGSNSTSMRVEDAGYFFDGFGIEGEVGDIIQLEGSAEIRQIVSIDYATNTLTLNSPLSWENGKEVALAYSGGAPDIGAFEFNGSILCGGTECSSGQICCNGICTRPSCTATGGCEAGQQCINPGLCSAACQNINCPETRRTTIASSWCRTPRTRGRSNGSRNG